MPGEIERRGLVGIAEIKVAARNREFVTRRGARGDDLPGRRDDDRIADLLDVAPPSANHHAHFGRHVDKETGVGAWFEPLKLEYEFVYAGTGKKGGY